MTVPLGEGSRLGRWTLEDVLGVGGMGAVHLAVDERGRHVALKVIRPDLAADRLFRSRFQREIRILRTVAGAGIAAIVDADADAAVPWFATEYIPGPTLGEAVERDGVLSQDNVRALAVALLHALQRLHRVGVVHRDLKPSNVILTPSGPVVIDFGIAHALDASTSLTGTGTTLGSPGWISPEQVLGNEVTSAADVFGWGAVIAYAATAQPPFGTGRPDALLYRVVHAEPSLDGIRDPALQAMVQAALSKDPSGRPSVAGLLTPLVVSTGADATTALIERTWSWTPTEVRSVTRVVGPRSTPALPPVQRRLRLLRYAWVSAVLVAVAALVVGIAALGQDGASARSTRQRLPTAPSTTSVSTTLGAHGTTPPPTTQPRSPATPPTTRRLRTTPPPVTIETFDAIWDDWDPDAQDTACNSMYADGVDWFAENVEDVRRYDGWTDDDFWTAAEHIFAHHCGDVLAEQSPNLLEQTVRPYLYDHVPALREGNYTGRVECDDDDAWDPDTCVYWGFPNDMGGQGLDVEFAIETDHGEVTDIVQTLGTTLEVND